MFGFYNSPPPKRKAWTFRPLLYYNKGKFTMTVELVGIFNCSNATTDEVKRQVHGEVYDQLFPYMQSQCASLAAASGVPGLMLRKVPIDPNNIAINKKGGPDNDRNPDGGPKLTLLE